MLLHGMREARDRRHRGAREVGAERGGVQRRRHQDDPQRGPVREHVPQQDEQKVGIERSLVNLVDDDVRDAREQRVLREPSKQHAGGDEQDPRRLGRDALQTNLVPDARALGAELFASFLRDSRSHGRGGDAPRLRANHAAPAALPPCDGVVQYELRQLGRLTAAGLAGDDHNLVGANRREEFRAFGPRGEPLTLRVRRVEIVPFRSFPFRSFPRTVGAAGRRPNVSLRAVPSLRRKKNLFAPRQLPQQPLALSGDSRIRRGLSLHLRDARRGPLGPFRRVPRHLFRGERVSLRGGPRLL
mmetsp:Transcript_3541/g.14176  ORF Transcript_3541/g.14176 Transcript_3541/m.14176 type:complete len:300 (-) Transcript_3541:1674-2573(-)